MKKTGVLILLLALSFAACGNGSKTETDNTQPEEVIEPICLTPKAGPYNLKFTDISEEMGVQTLNALGTQITIADIDGDKWPDVYTTMTSKLREDQNEPQNLYKLLKNVKGRNFEDITFTSGLFAAKNGTNGLASTYVVFADMNNDGFQDAFNVVYVDKNTLLDDSFEEDYSRVYLNNGDGTFKYIGGNFILEDYFSAIAGVTFLDYDHDGIIDMFLGRHYNNYGYLESCEQDTLMKGSGNGVFENVVNGTSGLETVKADDDSLAKGNFNKPTWGVTACDVDGDGFADILTSSYGRSYNMLYRNKGDGTFEDLSISSNFAHDNNENYGDDQFFACYCEAESNKDTDYCSISTGALISCDGVNGWEPGFSDQPYRLGGNSAGTLCGDFDGDGDIDLFQIELAHWHIGESSDKSQLIMNDGFPEKPLKRLSEEESGITRKRSGSWNDGDLGGLATDFDNDGKLDIYILSSDYPGTKSMLFQQQADGKFSETAKDAGAQVLRAHGGAFVDIDRDGDYDLIVGTSFMRWATTDTDGKKKPEEQWIKVLRNDTGQDANKVIIDISGSTANRDAIGAKIIVKAGGKQFVREVQGAYGLNGFQNDHLQIIGLGDICEVEGIEIHWPDKENSVTTYDKVFANYVLEINQETGLKHHKIEEYFGK
ncbi:CRTAC1 family protein [bacterium]|nr:CRTAC1 family protein [bacterium]